MSNWVAGIATGLMVGVGIGFTIGYWWETAWCMFKEGLAELRHTTGIQRKRRRQERRARRGLTLNMIGLILLLFGVTQLGVGAFEYTQSRRLTDLTDQVQRQADVNTSFIRCQAAYNEAFAEAYKPRAEATSNIYNTLYRFLRTVVPLFGDQQSTQEQVVKSREALEATNRAYTQYKADRKAHPLPAIPSEFCGNPSERSLKGK